MLLSLASPSPQPQHDLSLIGCTRNHLWRDIRLRQPSAQHRLFNFRLSGRANRRLPAPAAPISRSAQQGYTRLAKYPKKTAARLSDHSLNSARPRRLGTAVRCRDSHKTNVARQGVANGAEPRVAMAIIAPPLAQPQLGQTCHLIDGPLQQSGHAAVPMPR